MGKRKRTYKTIQWAKEKGHKRQYNGQKKKDIKDNAMAKRKRDIKEKQWPKEKGHKR